MTELLCPRAPVALMHKIKHVNVLQILQLSLDMCLSVCNVRMVLCSKKADLQMCTKQITFKTVVVVPIINLTNSKNL